jgi:hypothetical protein
MKINMKRLEKHGACEKGMKWLESLGTLDADEVIAKGIEQKRFSYLCYGIAHIMTKKQRVTWAIYCAEKCLDAFEVEYPEDDRPRKAIAAAKAYLKRPCEKTKAAAYSAAYFGAESAAWSGAESAACEDVIRKGYEIIKNG